MKYRFIDLFAGAGGLSEGFIRAGYEAIAHIEMDHYACDSLKTRAAFHYLKENEKLDIYEDYLKNKKEKTDGSWLWNQVPKHVIGSVIQEAIGKETLPSLFERVDKLCNGKPIATQKIFLYFPCSIRHSLPSLIKASIHLFAVLPFSPKVKTAAS